MEIVGAEILTYKFMNLSLKELKNTKINTFSNTRTVQIAKFPKISHFFNQPDSSLSCHVPSFSSKRGHVGEKHVLIGRKHDKLGNQTCEV